MKERKKACKKDLYGKIKATGFKGVSTIRFRHA